MGSCVSVHKDSDSLSSIGLKNEKLLIPSRVKEKPLKVNAGDSTAADVAVSSLRSPARYSNLGSKDEAFFDSQPWSESDCDDDFVSVNGDLSSSGGNSPVHQDSSLGKPLVNKLAFGEANGCVPEPPPPDKKKRLSELFKESLRNDEYDDEDKSAANKNEAPTRQLKSADGTPDFSRANSVGSTERATPNGALREEAKSLRSPQCCFPKLLSNRSLNDRRPRE